MVKSVSDLIHVTKLKVMFIGDAGAGKTFLAGTAGKHEVLGPILFLSLEGGLESVAHMQGVYYEEITSMKKLEEVWQTLNDNDGVWDGIKFNSVAIDSATEMQTLDVDEIVASKMTRGGKRTKDEVYLEDYGISTRRLARIFRSFRNLNMHTFFTCLPKYTLSNSGNSVLSIDPLLTPKLAGLFRGYMSFVWYVYIAQDPNDNKDKRFLMTESNGIVKCKSRGHGFNQYLRKTFNHVIPQPYMDLGWIYDMYVENQEAYRKITEDALEAQKKKILGESKK